MVDKVDFFEGVKNHFESLEVKIIENVLKKNFSITWRWFYRMQIPMIIGYHDMFEDLTTFHVWGTVCMNQAFNYKTSLIKRNGSNQTHEYIDFQRELFTGDYNKFNESIRDEVIRKKVRKEIIENFENAEEKAEVEENVLNILELDQIQYLCILFYLGQALLN